MASTSSSLTIPPIKAKSDPEIATENSQAFATYSVKEVTANGSTTRVLVDVMDGLWLLGEPLGPVDLTKSFFKESLKDNEADTMKLLDSGSDHHTALCLFTQLTFRKLTPPLLLGLEVMYCIPDMPYKSWDY